MGIFLFCFLLLQKKTSKFFHSFLCLLLVLECRENYYYFSWRKIFFRALFECVKGWCWGEKRRTTEKWEPYVENEKNEWRKKSTITEDSRKIISLCHSIYHFTVCDFSSFFYILLRRRRCSDSISISFFFCENVFRLGLVSFNPMNIYSRFGSVLFLAFFLKFIYIMFFFCAIFLSIPKLWKNFADNVEHNFYNSSLE